MTYYEKNKEKIRARIAARTPEEKAHRIAWDKAYYLKNKEKLREQNRVNRMVDADGKLARRRAEYDPQRNREQNVKTKYGLTPTEYDGLFSSQQNACAICKRLDAGTKRRWHVDHNHDSKKVRGILCHNCNVGLGHMKDNVELLRAAADYLDLHEMINELPNTLRYALSSEKR